MKPDRFVKAVLVGLAMSLTSAPAADAQVVRAGTSQALAEVVAAAVGAVDVEVVAAVVDIRLIDSSNIIKSLHTSIGNV